MNELELFAGAGGGILGGMLLGHRPVCAVEYDAYARSVLLARQADGTFPPFPVWDDVRTFRGEPWRGIVDVVSGGFPCQDISVAGSEPESTAQEADSGARWPGSLAKYDRATCSWKTAQRSLLGDLEPCSVTWPRSGLMLDGQCWELPTLERRTDASESGYWPTPNTVGYRSDGELKMLGCKLSNRTEYVLMTDRACRSKRDRYWPTPQASDNRDRGNASTPAIARRIEAGKQVMLSMTVSTESGRLNPEWVELLMGWPKGWTRLSPLE